MTQTVRYTYRLRPGAQAERALFEEWGRCRWLWNEAVHQQKTGRKPTLARLGKMLTAARADFTWVRDGSRVAEMETLRTYLIALDRSFKIRGCRRPTAKRRKTSFPSLAYHGSAFRIRTRLIRTSCIRYRRLTLPKGISVPIVWSRDLPSEPTSVRVYQDSLGHWYASFVVTRETEPAPRAHARIGVDWGVRTTATTTDPAYDLPYGGYRKRCAAELAKAQRRMARRRRSRGQAQSSGYRQARRESAKLHKKAARQNQHAARVWAKRIVDNHQTIAVEDFRPAFLAKSTLARKAADAAIGMTKRELIQRGMRAGRKVVLVPPAYTTMTCSECGTRAKERLGLAERTFCCDQCGYTADRDRNAARVILAMAERGRAGADDVRHSLTSSRRMFAVLSEPEISRLSVGGSVK